MSDDGPLSVDELVEYCRTQAGLLAGRRETLGAETDALLDEIDEDIAEVRTRLAANSGPGQSTASAPTPRPDGHDALADVEELETEVEEKQAVAEAKQARMAAFGDLSAAYAELAADLEATVDDGRAALDRVVGFERDRDAPAYFEDRLTVLEAAAESGE